MVLECPQISISYNFCMLNPTFMPVLHKFQYLASLGHPKLAKTRKNTKTYQTRTVLHLTVEVVIWY